MCLYIYEDQCCRCLYGSYDMAVLCCDNGFYCWEVLQRLQLDSFTVLGAIDSRQMKCSHWHACKLEVATTNCRVYVNCLYIIIQLWSLDRIRTARSESDSSGITSSGSFWYCISFSASMPRGRWTHGGACPGVRARSSAL